MLVGFEPRWQASIEGELVDGIGQDRQAWFE